MQNEAQICQQIVLLKYVVYMKNCPKWTWLRESINTLMSSTTQIFGVLFLDMQPKLLYSTNCVFSFALQSLVIPDKFQHILRIMNTNIDGKRKVGIAMTAIKGVGRRYSNIVLKKADVDLTKRAGECTEEEVM